MCIIENFKGGEVGRIYEEAFSDTTPLLFLNVFE